MSSGALRAAWEAAQQQQPSESLRRAWEAAQRRPEASEILDTPAVEHAHREFAAGTLGGRMQRENANEAERTADETQPSYGQRALGGVAALARDIPGAEAAQAGARALVRRQPYREALSDIRGAEASAGGVGRLNGIVGGVVAAAALPGSPAMQGARYGILSALGASDPDADLKQRIDNAAVQGTVGGLTGKAGDMLLTGGRALLTKPLGAQAIARKEAMTLADKAAYGRAAREGTANAIGPRPPAVQQAFSAKDIEPYIQAVRESRQFANADDATLIREAYKLMTERQGTLANRVINASDYKAGSQLEKMDIGAAKQELMKAGDALMPSFRPAVAQHAEMAGEAKAMQTGADAARRLIRGTGVAGKRLAAQSPEGFRAQVAAMTPGEAGAALKGVLGRAKEGIGLSANPHTLFGIGSTVRSVGNVTPAVQALERQSGGAPALVDLVRAYLASQSQNPFGK